MLTLDGDHVTALVGSLGCLYDGRLAYGQVGLGIHVVRNGILVLDLVHVGKDDRAGNGIGGHLDLEFVTGLGLEFRSESVDAAEDHFLDDVQVLTGKGEHIAGKDRGGSEGFHLDGLGESQFGEGSPFLAALGDDGHFTDLGAFHRDKQLQGIQFGALGDSEEFGHGDVAREVDLGYLIQIASEDKERTAAHDRIRSHTAEREALAQRVDLDLFLAAAGESQHGGKEGNDGRICKDFFHMRFNYLMGTTRMLSM